MHWDGLGFFDAVVSPGALSCGHRTVHQKNYN